MKIKSVDYKQLLKSVSVSDRLNIAKSSVASELLNQLTPIERAKLFPKYYLDKANQTTSSPPPSPGLLDRFLTSLKPPMPPSDFYSSRSYKKAEPEPEPTDQSTNTEPTAVPKKDTTTTTRTAPPPKKFNGKGNPLSSRRQKIAGELSQEDRLKIMAIAMAEEGNKPLARKRIIETMFNRADAYKMPINSRNIQEKYYSPLMPNRDPGGYKRYQQALDRLRNDPAFLEEMTSELDEVISGSNHSNYATQNSSLGVADNARKGQTIAVDDGQSDLMSRKDKKGTKYYDKREDQWYKDIQQEEQDYLEQAQETAKSDPTEQDYLKQAQEAAKSDPTAIIPETNQTGKILPDSFTKPIESFDAEPKKESVGNITPTAPTAIPEEAKELVYGTPRFGAFKGREYAGKNMDPRMIEILTEASKTLPDGYSLQYHSGNRSTNRSNHSGGRAFDVVIVGPDGEPVYKNNYKGNSPTGRTFGNYQNPAAFKIYERLAQAAKEVQKEKYPKMPFRWGGYFGGGRNATGYGAMDLMHFDNTGGPEGSQGSFEKGVTGFGAYGDFESNVGMGHENYVSPFEEMKAELERRKREGVPGEIKAIPQVEAPAPVPLENRGITSIMEPDHIETAKLGTVEPSNNVPKTTVEAPNLSAEPDSEPEQPQTPTAVPAPVEPSDKAVGRAAGESPTKITPKIDVKPTQSTPDVPMMKTGGEVQASGEDFSIVDNNSKRKLGEVSRGENIKFNTKGRVEVTPDQRIDPRALEAAQEVRQEHHERVVENKQETPQATMMQGARVPEKAHTQFSVNEQWGHTETPASYVRAMAQAKGRKHDGSFPGSRFGEEQLSAL